MKNILIPTDFSDVSLNAIAYAETFFKGVSANLYLLSVTANTHATLLPEEQNKHLFDETINQLKHLTDTYNNSSDLHHQYHAISKSGTLISSIKNVINVKAIDLIVTGTKGASGLKEIFIGSNTVKIINHIDNCPILVVPNGYKFQGLHQAVFSTNYKRKFNLNELKDLIKIITMHNCDIEVVQLTSDDYMTEAQKQNKKELEAYLEDLEFHFQKLDWQDSETKTVQNYIKDTNSDLLTLINHKQNFLNKLTEENIVEKASFNSPIPILILPEIN